MAFLAIFVFNFHSGLIQTLICVLKGITQAKYFKNLLIMSVSLMFSQHWTQFGPNFVPRLHLFFCWFPMKMLWDLVNINNFDCSTVVVKKKLVQPLKITISGSNLYKKGVAMDHAQNKNYFFYRSNNLIIHFQTLFILSMYEKFRLSYECFSILRILIFC